MPVSSYLKFHSGEDSQLLQVSPPFLLPLPLRDKENQKGYLFFKKKKKYDCQTITKALRKQPYTVPITIRFFLVSIGLHLKLCSVFASRISHLCSVFASRIYHRESAGARNRARRVPEDSPNRICYLEYDHATLLNTRSTNKHTHTLVQNTSKRTVACKQRWTSRTDSVDPEMPDGCVC